MVAQKPWLLCLETARHHHRRHLHLGQPVWYQLNSEREERRFHDHWSAIDCELRLCASPVRHLKKLKTTRYHRRRSTSSIAARALHVSLTAS